MYLHCYCWFYYFSVSLFYFFFCEMCLASPWELYHPKREEDGFSVFFNCNVLLNIKLFSLFILLFKYYVCCIFIYSVVKRKKKWNEFCYLILIFSSIQFQSLLAFFGGRRLPRRYVFLIKCLNICVFSIFFSLS